MADTVVIECITPAAKNSSEDASENALQTIHKDITDLSKFQLNRVLSSDSRSKTISGVGGFIGKDGQAIVFLEKTPLEEDHIKILCSSNTALKQISTNDIYGEYLCFPEQGLNTLKAHIIHPATDQHVRKYERRPFHIVDETPEVYKTITLPHIKSEHFNIDWVFNVLEHKSEVDRIVAEDDDPNTGFVLALDSKWAGLDMKSLYLLALVRPRGIKSLRDLTAEHIPLLENILNKGTEAIKQKYSIPQSQLRIYIHYHPSFYHLHVHFTYLMYDAPGINCGRAHLLTSVINNLRLESDYYQKATIPFMLTEGFSLFTKFCEKGILQPAQPLGDGNKPTEEAV